MRTLLPLVVLAVLLGGCIDDDPLDAGGAPDLSSADDPAGDDNATAPPPLGPPIDPWGEATELLVYEGVARDVTCSIAGTPDSPEFMWITPVCDNTELAFPDGPLIPEGAKTLIVEADASDALKSGSYHFFMYTVGRNTWDVGNAERTDSPQYTWNIGLTPLDWDPDHRTRTPVMAGFWPSGTGVNTLLGDIQVTMTAVRDPAWEPRIPVDEFLLEDRHDIVAPGVVRLVDTNETWEFPSPATSALGILGWDVPPDIPLAIIPGGTKHIVYGFSWTVADCPEAHDCSPNPSLRRGAHWPEAEELERSATHVVYRVEVPEAFADDGPYAEAGTATIWPFVWRCAEPLAATGLGCLASFYAFGASIETRIRAEAWQEDADLEDFKARLGVA